MPNIRDESAVCGAEENAKLIQKHQDKETLLDELSDWLLESDGENFDIQKLSALLDELDQIDPLEDDFDPQASLASFRKEHQAEFEAIAAASKSAEPTSKKRARISLKKTLLVAAALAALVSLVSVTATGFDFGALFGRWSDSVFDYSEVQDAYATVGAYPISEGESKEYESLQDALDDFGVKGDIAPRWMPERFEPVHVEAVVNRNGVTFYADYLSDSREVCAIKITEFDSATQGKTEKDEVAVRAHKINQIAHYFVSDLELEKVSWVNGELECLIYGNVSYEEMRKIVDSIYGG